MRRIALLAIALAMVAPRADAAIRVHPLGVNVNNQGATSIFLTFGGLKNQVAAEALFCGQLVPAAPAIGSRCDPATIFGSPPLRFNESRLSGTAALTAVMSISPSVARRAYQAARSGETSSFFYVRRFVSTVGGPDEFVSVTCRMSGGGARTALSLLDVQLVFSGGAPLEYVSPRGALSPFAADITYTGTGRLKGRWEVVAPGDQLPTPEDLVTEGTLPIEQRGQQRRYAQLERFNVFLPPTGRITLTGPNVSRLPTDAVGAYLILLRIEATDDKEADSDLSKAAGAGPGLVHSGAVAGFPMPVLRYIVGGGARDRDALQRESQLDVLLPPDSADLSSGQPLEFTWIEIAQAAVYRVEIYDGQEVVFSGLVPSGAGIYRAPPWVKDKIAGGELRWRIVALDVQGKEIRVSAWRSVRLRVRN